MREHGTPPPLAAALLERRLPPELAEAIHGDLEERYRERVLPRRGRLLADAWFWGQALTIRAHGLRTAARRLQEARPHPSPTRGPHVQHLTWSSMLMHPHDLKYAIRRLARSPGFSLVAVLSLALGIGANTAMFSVVNAVLLRGLPVANGKELVEVYTSEADGFAHSTSSHPDYRDLREQSEAFSAVVASRTFLARIDDDGLPRVVFGELVSWDYFQTLGVPMALGRPFLAEEDETPGTHPVAILGHRTWVRDFAADPAVVGRDVRLNGRSYTIVGVAPESFPGTMPILVTGFYVPLMMTDEILGSEQLAHRSSRSMFLKARLRPGVTVEQANASLVGFSQRLAEQYPGSNENRIMSAVPSTDVALHPMVDRVLTPVAGLLMGVVGLVLLIACANLASFLLARAEERRKEIAVRLALGAGRTNLVRQLLIESTLLAALGGLAGVVLADATVGLLLAFRPPLPLPIDFDVPLDRSVLLFTAGVSVLAGFAFGLLPALQATNPDVAPTLKNEGSRSGAPGGARLRGGLVVAQVAFSFVLLIGAGLFMRSLQKAQTVDPGFDTGPGALVWPMPELSGYETPDEVRGFYNELERRLLAHPVVSAVAFADRLPLGFSVQLRSYVLPDVPSDSPDGDHDIDNANVSASYFDAMGVEIVAGRAFDAREVGDEPVLVVSQAFVDRYYPGQDVVGRAIRSGEAELRIVGIAADTKVRTLGEAPRPYVYHLQGQTEFFGMQVLVKGAGTSEELVRVTRQVLDEVDPNIVLFEEPKTMEGHLALLLFPPRMAALLLSVFGGLALLLAAVGIYGVVSHAVSRRTRELGIRLSLGASGRDVVGMAVGGGMKLVLAGGTIGVLMAGVLAWAISGLLFGIGPNDLVTFLAIPVLLSAVALLAAWVPARRASAIDPVRALRSE